MTKRLLSLLAALCLLTAVLAGCGSSSQSTATDSAAEEPAAEEESAAEPEESEEAEGEVSSSAVCYPLEETATLTMFTSFPGNLVSYMTSFTEHPGFAAAEEATGVTIDFYEYSMESAATQFELMVASDSLPDLVCGFDDMYQGGVSAGYDADLIYDISGLLEENAPDYLAAVNASDTNRSIAYELDGTTMLAVYGFYLYDYSEVTNGVFIRQDWLDDLGLDVPVTYDDWYDVLTQFKDAYGASAALLLPNGTESSGGTYAGGYGVPGYSSEAKSSAQHFYQVDGVVTSCLIEDAYRDYLIMLNKWYEEGLIYGDFYSNDTRDIMDGLIYDNQVGIFDGKVDYITRYESGDTTGTIRLTGIRSPVQNAEDINGFGSYVSAKSSLSISTNCETPETALQWLNYFFTDEGILLACYGEEGVSYTFNASGDPEFTDLILNNEDPELAYGNVTRLYLLDEVLPTVYDQTRELAAYSEAEQDAIALWTDTKDAVYTLPDFTLSTEDSEEFSSILVDVETYASECIVKFIIGDMNLAQWDSFVETLKDMGIERCIEIYQDALDTLSA